MESSFLAKTALFQGIPAEDLSAVLECLKAEERHYKKGEAVYRAGDTVSRIGLVVAGRITIENDDFWGNRSILDSVGPGRVFAEAYACAPGEPLMVSAVAAEPADILFFAVERILAESPWHHVLARNLLFATARKNLNLSRRIFHTSSKTIRGRVLSYLSTEAARRQKREFSIPFSRQQLAGYLGVDRSALSHELGKMQREGLITVQKNRFSFPEREQPEKISKNT